MKDFSKSYEVKPLVATLLMEDFAVLCCVYAAMRGKGTDPVAVDEVNLNKEGKLVLPRLSNRRIVVRKQRISTKEEVIFIPKEIKEELKELGELVNLVAKADFTSRIYKKG